MESLLKITNAPFQIEFDGKPYQVRKASLEQVVKFMQKADQFKKEGMLFTEQWVRLVAYALFLSLSSVDASITEDYVSKNIPGGMDATEVLITLGFINPKRAAMAQVAKAEIPTTENSSPSSPTEQVGSPAK
jgi:hypothetical protein